MGDNKYLKSSIEGMNNNELIELLYQETIKNVKKAEYSIENKNIEDKVYAINKAIEIITALISVINDDEGGDISKRLRALYNFSTQQLTLANIHNSVAILQPVNNIFRELLSAWSQMMKGDTPTPTNNSFNNNANSYGSSGDQGLEIYG